MFSDTPVDINTAGVKTIYPDYGGEGSVSFNLRSVPALVQGHISVKKDSVTATPQVLVTEDHSGIDTYIVEVKFTSVKSEDYGSYTLIVNNGIGIYTSYFFLGQKGTIHFCLVDDMLD